MELKEMRRMVLNPSTPEPILEEIYELNRKEKHAHAIWVALSLHPRCSETLRELIFPHLFWRDLLKVVDCPAVTERTKQKALRLLKQRMEKAAVGEWKALARVCPPKLFSWVMKQNQPELFSVLLDNSRMTENALVQLIHSPAMQAEFSIMIADHRLWQNRRSVRIALIYCKKTDLTTALISLKKVTKPELMAIEKTLSLHPLIRRTASALLTGKDGKQ